MYQSFEFEDENFANYTDAFKIKYPYYKSVYII